MNNDWSCEEGLNVVGNFLKENKIPHILSLSLFHVPRTYDQWEEGGKEADNFKAFHEQSSDTRFAGDVCKYFLQIPFLAMVELRLEMSLVTVLISYI